MSAQIDAPKYISLKRGMYYFGAFLFALPLTAKADESVRLVCDGPGPMGAETIFETTSNGYDRRNVEGPDFLTFKLNELDRKCEMQWATGAFYYFDLQTTANEFRCTLLDNDYAKDEKNELRVNSREWVIDINRYSGDGRFWSRTVKNKKNGNNWQNTYIFPLRDCRLESQRF